MAAYHEPGRRVQGMYCKRSNEKRQGIILITWMTEIRKANYSPNKSGEPEDQEI
jgi:hypothetical protein